MHEPPPPVLPSLHEQAQQVQYTWTPRLTTMRRSATLAAERCT